MYGIFTYKLTITNLNQSVGHVWSYLPTNLSLAKINQSVDHVWVIFTYYIYPLQKHQPCHVYIGKYTDPIVPLGIHPWQTEDLALVPLDAPLNFIRGSHLVRLLVAKGMEELRFRGVDPKSHLFFPDGYLGDARDSDQALLL